MRRYGDKEMLLFAKETTDASLEMKNVTFSVAALAKVPEIKTVYI